MDITRGAGYGIATVWRMCILCVLTAIRAANGEAGQSAAGVLEATLCDADTIPEATARQILREATAVFHEAGITLRFETSSGRECGMGGPAVLLVRIETAPVRAEAPDSRAPVASIQFIDGRPGRTITLSLSAARYLMRRDPVTRSLLPRVSVGVEHRWIGRMLGRALAHEIGHYILRSSRHSPTGLMRATHSVQAFLDPARAAFRLALEERQALVLRLLDAPRADADASQR